MTKNVHASWKKRCQIVNGCTACGKTQKVGFVIGISGGEFITSNI
jgi:hypothetical protein